MIPIETKQDILNRWVIKRHSKREISRELKISRGTVNKVINGYQQNRFELNLTPKTDITNNTYDVGYTPPLSQNNRTPYKLNNETLLYIKKIVIENENHNLISGSSKIKSTKMLFEDLQKQKLENPNIISDISINSFYKYIKKFKHEIYEFDLTQETNSMNEINKIIGCPPPQFKRRPYKLNDETILYINEMVEGNERLVKSGLNEAKSTKELFEDFKKQKFRKPNLITDISMDIFYKYVRKFKKEIYKKNFK